MVTSTFNLNEKCCFDFGNAETNNLDNKAGHMDAINIMCHGNPCSPDAGLDMEDGIYGHLKVPAGTTFVTDMGTSDGQHTYAIYQGNAHPNLDHGFRRHPSSQRLSAHATGRSHHPRHRRR